MLQITLFRWPIQFNGGAGHDNNFPLWILMALLNHVPKRVDNGDCEGRKGPVEMYVCGVLREMGVWNLMIK